MSSGLLGALDTELLSVPLGDRGWELTNDQPDDVVLDRYLVAATLANELVAGGELRLPGCWWAHPPIVGMLLALREAREENGSARDKVGWYRDLEYALESGPFQAAKRHDPMRHPLPGAELHLTAPLPTFEVFLDAIGDRRTP